MRVFIERFVLAILASLVVLLAAINPMEFSWPARIISIIGIVILASIAAYLAGWDEWRWERLRAVWWLWLISGVSGGVALAVWLSPVVFGPPQDLGSLHADLRAPVSVSAPQSDEDVKRIAALQSQLNQAQQERDHAVQNLGTLQSELSSKNVELGNIRQHVTTLQSQLSETQRGLTDIRNRDETRLGPNTSIGFVDVLTLSDALKTIPKTLVLLTSTPDNEQLRSLLENMFAAARGRLGGKSPLMIMGRPNYDKELDAPRLQETPGNGITIHGRNPAGDYLMQHVFAMNSCFDRRQTAKTPDEFLTYYHLIGGANDIKDIAWIEIGHSPVLRFSGCLNQ